MGGKHQLTKIFIKEHFNKTPPLIPANGHYYGEDKERDQISPREEQVALYANRSTSSLGHQIGQRAMFPASHSTSALSGPPTPSSEAAPGLALLRYKLTSLPSVPSLQRETSLVSMASGQTGLSRQVSTPCLQPQETDMRSLRSNMSDPAFSHGPSHTLTPGQFSHQKSLHSHQPQVTLITIHPHLVTASSAVNNKTDADKTEKQEHDGCHIGQWRGLSGYHQEQAMQDHEMVNLEMEASGGERRRPSGSSQSS